jgi:hypothetical protein
VFEEFFQAILVHLYGAYVLFLFHINVSDVQPNIVEVGGGFTYLSENVAGLNDAALVGEHGTDAVGGPNVFGVVAKDLWELKLNIMDGVFFCFDAQFEKEKDFFYNFSKKKPAKFI